MFVNPAETPRGRTQPRPERADTNARRPPPLSDKPGAPMGPLRVSEVYAEGCKLTWNPPADDGGCPIDHYVVEKMDEATGRWMPAGETDGKETNFDVEDLTPGHRYKFRVKAVNRLGTSDPLTTQQAIEAKNPFGE